MKKIIRQLAKNLRNQATNAENHLWYSLRLKQIENCKFRRQQPIGNYIVDFICLPKKLIIEVDGSQHLESETDKKRDQWLKNQGFTVLHFWNNEVLQNTEGVLEIIRQHCINIPHHKVPPPRGGRLGGGESSGEEQTKTTLPSHQTKVKLLSLIFLSILFLIPSKSIAQEKTCTTNWQFATLEETQLIPEKQKFDPIINDLAKKENTASSLIIETGVNNIRRYHKKLSAVCSNIRKSIKESCQDITQEELNREVTQCLDYVEKEISLQKIKLEKIIMSDATKKKVEFWVKKYQEINQKFEKLISTIFFIQGEIKNLLYAIDKITSNQFPN